jgi:DNA-binding MarR family transcriptional regulator
MYSHRCCVTDRADSVANFIRVRSKNMSSSTATPRARTVQERALSELRHLILATQREGNRWLMDALRPVGLTPSQAEILAVLAEKDGLTLVELGRSIISETGSPSRLVDNLVRRGLVLRQPGETDRRVVLLQLSETGRELADSVAEAETVLNDLICRQLPRPEQELLSTSLRKLLAGSRSGDILQRRFQNAAATDLTA